MTGYLDHVARRGSGNLPTITPRPRSRYEPGGSGMELTVEATAWPAAATVAEVGAPAAPQPRDAPDQEGVPPTPPIGPSAPVGDRDGIGGPVTVVARASTPSPVAAPPAGAAEAPAPRPFAPPGPGASPTVPAPVSPGRAAPRVAAPGRTTREVAARGSAAQPTAAHEVEVDAPSGVTAPSAAAAPAPARAPTPPAARTTGRQGDQQEVRRARSAVPDMAVPDMAVPDMAVPDMAVPDMAVPDTAVPDTAPTDTTTDARRAAEPGTVADLRAAPADAALVPGAPPDVDPPAPVRARSWHPPFPARPAGPDTAPTPTGRARRDSADRPPTVTVTIGRVEVRRPEPPLPPPVPEPAPSGPPPLSLAEYLDRPRT